jgi:hypothetical protein
VTALAGTRHQSTEVAHLGVRPTLTLEVEVATEAERGDQRRSWRQRRAHRVKTRPSTET